jgi:hypothetical protein
MAPICGLVNTASLIEHSQVIGMQQIVLHDLCLAVGHVLELMTAVDVTERPDVR